MDKETTTYDQQSKMIAEYPFLPLCFEFSSNYKNLLDGSYVFAQYTIKKCAIMYQDNTVHKTPTRVHSVTSIVEVNNNLYDYSFSGLLLSIVWAFIRKDCETNKAADKKAFEILINFPQFKPKDGIKDFCMMLVNTTPKENIDRASKLINILGDKTI
ncbi:MAG: hypothetical protein PHT07_21455 [Paludibacter sp.]|nr:hypothetical protein [Paludibacter sp.]